MTPNLGSRALTLTQRLVRSPSLNPGGTEAEVAALLGDLLAEAGFDVETYDFAPGRPSVVATFLPDRRTDRAVGLAGHIDTVPLGAMPWRIDPFAGEIREGRLYGRGSSDMKSGIATAVVAAIDAARSGAAPGGIVVVLCAAEETGCEGAAQLEAAGVLPPVEKLVITEPTGNDVLVAHKGALWLRIVAEGTTAHGSMPHLGDNAITHLREAIRHIERVDVGGDHPLLGAGTRTLTQIHAGMNVNSVADRAEATFDVRTVPGTDHDSLLEAFRTAVGAGVTLEAITDLPPLDTSVDGPWVTQVCGIAARITGRPQPGGGVSYFTDASVLHRAMGSPPTVVCGPGLAEQAHRTDEYCLVDDIEESTAILRKILETT